VAVVGVKSSQFFDTMGLTIENWYLRIDIP